MLRIFFLNSLKFASSGILTAFFIVIMTGGGYSLSVASETGAPDFGSADKHALEAPSSAERDMRRLAAYLTEPFEGDEALQARAIYRWITDRIRYDTGAFFGGRQISANASPQEVLETRRALCGGYADLFTFLATEAGLEAVSITGHSKGYGFSPEEARRDGLDSNHAWNAVRIDGQWELLDATWGAGFIDDETRSFSKSFEDHYFFTAPESFIYDHFPDESRWQLLDTPVSEEEYLGQAWVRPAFFQHGLSLESHPQQYIEVSGSVSIEVKLSEESVLNARLSKNGVEPAHRPLLVTYEENRAVVEVTPPERGRYELELFVREAAKTGQQYNWAMSYTIDSRRGSSDAGYPETFAQFSERRSNLEQPRSYLLRRGSTQHFSMRIPGAQEVTVINDGDWTILERDGNHFSGDVALKRGDVQVAARFSAAQSGSYDVLLQYMAR